MLSSRIAPLGQFHDWLLDKHDQLAPQSLLGKAVVYTLSQWPKLMRYLDDPILGPDTNPTERAIRPFVIGRKNWVPAGSPRGARASAALYSLVETAGANGHESMFYLWWMLERLPMAQSPDTTAHSCRHASHPGISKVREPIPAPLLSAGCVGWTDTDGYRQSWEETN
ncbi:MAG: transposase [Spirochaetaceae bacterium]